MSPFDPAQASLIGFFFGSVISWLLAQEYYHRLAQKQLDKLIELLEGVHADTE